MTNLLSVLLFSKSSRRRRSQPGEAFQPDVLSNYNSNQFEAARPFHMSEEMSSGPSTLNWAIKTWDDGEHNCISYNSSDSALFWRQQNSHQAF